MNPMTEYIICYNNLRKDKDINLDIINIRKNLKNIFTNLIIRNIYVKDYPTREKRIVKTIKQLIIARSKLSECMAVFQSHIEYGNKFLEAIDSKKQVHGKFIENLGVANSRLDKKMSEISKLELKPRIGENIVSASILEEVKNEIYHYVCTFIIYPLKNSIIKFNEKDKRDIYDEYGKIIGTKNIKNREDYFFFLLFNELFCASEIEGSKERLIFSKSGGDIKINDIDIQKSSPAKKRDTLEGFKEESEKEKIINFDDLLDMKFSEEELYDVQPI